MLEAIKGIVGDIAADAIEDQRIDLTLEQLEALELKLHDTLAQNAALAKRVAELEALMEERNAQVAKLQPAATEDLEPETLNILKFFFDRASEMTAEHVAHWHRIAESVARYHLDILIERRFIRLTGIPPGYYSIQPEGRKYIIQLTPQAPKAIRIKV